MREIKFRGKSLDKGKWLYGSLLSWKCGYMDMLIEYDTCEMFDEIPVDPSTVGQYTGLRDKTGREIYEGDILSVDFLSYKTEVKYHIDGFMACRENYPSEPLYRVYKECVVIGNLHDNPELMDNK